MRSLVKSLMVLLAALTAVNAYAHHGFATEFDVNRPVELKGKVTKVELINPHSWIHIEVIGEDGKPVAWMIEGGSPNALLRRGINRNTIAIGSELVIRGYGTRDGLNKAVGREIEYADGRPLFFQGSAPDGETVP
ncbi:MAG: hypothetical protein H6978_07055 [Gammaproteobacteria bacterium]|nr:hypothetical protein [Gammaproteobacteria bacterium]